MTKHVDIRQFARLLKHTESPFTGQPFILEPWQDDYLNRLFNTKLPDGRRQYRKSFVFLPRKAGKALALDTPVFTPDGWKTMGTVEVGDRVFHPSGKQVTVVAVSEVMTDRECYAVKFAGGETIVADAEHFWKTRTRSGDKVRTTRDIASSCTSVFASGKSRSRHFVDVASPLRMRQKRLPVDPYVLGAWLGDGHKGSRNLTFDAREMDVVNSIRMAGASVKISKATGDNVSVASIDIGGYGSLVRELRKLGVFRNKHIPRLYFLASEQQRKRLLQGLMDTDGTCSPEGQCTFVNTNKELAVGVIELAASLGHKATIREYEASIDGKVTGPCYHVHFRPKANREVFSSPRKQARLRPQTSGADRTKSRAIVSCEPCPSVPVRCIQVSEPDGMFLVGKSLIPTHNSSLVAVVALYEALFGQHGGQILIGAGDREQARKLFDMIKNFIDSCPGIAKRVKVFKNSIFVPSTKTTVQIISREAKTKHGFNPSLVIVDELHVQPDRSLIDVLTSGMGARAEPLVVFISTAGMDRIGPCYEEFQRAVRVRDGLIEDPTYLPLLYYADTEDDPFDESTWRKAQPNYMITVTKEFMENEMRLAKESVADELKFRTLYLNQWASNGADRFFRTGQWEACDSPLREPGGRPCYIGVDLSSTQDTTAVSWCWRDDSDGTYDFQSHVFIPEENVDRSEAPYRQWAKEGYATLTEGNVVDYDVVREFVFRLCEKYDVRGVAVDRWNATHFVTQLTNEGIDVKPFGQGYASMSAPTKLLSQLVLSGSIRHAGNPPLALHMSHLQVKQDDAGNLKPTKKNSSAHSRDDAAVAAIMALGIASAEAEPPEGDYEVLVL